MQKFSKRIQLRYLKNNLLTLDVSLDILGLDLELPVGCLVPERVAAVVIDLVVVLDDGHGVGGGGRVLAQGRRGQQEGLRVWDQNFTLFYADVLQAKWFFSTLISIVLKQRTLYRSYRKQLKLPHNDEIFNTNKN